LPGGSLCQVSFTIPLAILIRELIMEHEAWKTSRFNYPSHVPTMISAEEKLYLYWLGEKVWTGRGIVVEIGSWLGGSTICLAAGMMTSAHDDRKRFHVFDNFIWREFMSARAPLPIEPGDSFRDHFLDNIRDYKDVVESHESALPDEHIEGDMEAGGKRFSEEDRVPILEESPGNVIEILFIDGAKSWRGMCHLLKVFRPSLVPRHSYIVCQDYKYWGTYWVPVMMIRLKEYLEPIHNVLEGTTVAFRMRSEIPMERLEEMEDQVCNMQTEQTLSYLDLAALQLAEDGDLLGSRNTSLAKVSFLSHQQRIDDAVSEFKKIQRAWPTFSRIGQLERAREYLWNEKSRRIHRPKRFELSRLIKKAQKKFGPTIFGKPIA